MTNGPRRSRRLTTRAFLVALAATALLACALRLLVCVELRAHPSVGQPAVVTDMATYRRLALDIRDGKWPTHFYYQPFYYAVFLPVLYRTCGSGPWGPALAQVLLGAATVWLVGLAGARLWGRRAGLTAAVLLALSRMPIFYTPFLLIATLQSFWLALIVYLALRFWARRDLRGLCALALVSGAATLTRGNVVLLLPGIVGLVALRLRSRPRRALAWAALLLVLFYLPQLPFALRNLRHFGRWTGPSSAQDAVLALGNSPEAPPGGLEYPDAYHDWMDLAGRTDGTRVPVSRQVLRWAGAHPLQFAELKARMLLLFWHRTEIPNNVALSREGRHAALLRLPPPLLLDFAWVAVPALLGLFTLCRRRSPPKLFLLFVTVAYTLGTAMFYILTRFRLPLVPVLCILAGGSLWRAVALATRAPTPEKLRRNRLALLLGVALSAFVVLCGFSWYRDILEPAVARRLRPEGTVLRTHRRILVYDHGPFSLGGMAMLPLPEEGLTVHKRLVAPDPLPPGPARVRVPVRLAPGTRFEAHLHGDHSSVGTNAMTVEETPFGQRLVFELGKPETRDREISLSLTLRPSSGSMAIAADGSRWYGRSEWRRGDQPLHLPLEAAIEIEWPAPREAP